MSFIEIENLSKKYGKKEALKSISLNIEKGRIVGLLGPNGSGKTTLIKLVMNLLQKDKGSILFEGEEITYKTLEDISFLPDRNFLNENMKVKDMLKLFKGCFRNFSEEKAKELLEKMNINLLDVFKKLSKGNQEKVQLILTMSRKAKLYILDEPIAGVDPAARDLIINTILNNYNKEATLIISTHLISDIENILDDVIFISEGNIILHESKNKLEEEHQKSINDLFREVFKC